MNNIEILLWLILAALIFLIYYIREINIFVKSFMVTYFITKDIEDDESETEENLQ